MPQVFRSVGQLTCFDISKNMLKRTRDAVGGEPCAGGEKVGPPPLPSQWTLFCCPVDPATCAKTWALQQRVGLRRYDSPGTFLRSHGVVLFGTVPRVNMVRLIRRRRVGRGVFLGRPLDGVMHRVGRTPSCCFACFCKYRNSCLWPRLFLVSAPCLWRSRAW